MLNVLKTSCYPVETKDAKSKMFVNVKEENHFDKLIQRNQFVLWLYQSENVVWTSVFHLSFRVNDHLAKLHERLSSSGVTWGGEKNTQQWKVMKHENHHAVVDRWRRTFSFFWFLKLSKSFEFGYFIVILAFLIDNFYQSIWSRFRWFLRYFSSTSQGRHWFTKIFSLIIEKLKIEFLTFSSKIFTRRK